MPTLNLARYLIMSALVLVSGSVVLAGAASLYVPLEANAPRRAVTALSAGSLDSRVAAGVAFVGFYNDATKDSVAVLDEVAAATGPDVFVGSINLSTERAKAAQYNIQNVPTFIVFKDGVPVSTIVGLRDKNFFVDAITAVQPAALVVVPKPVVTTSAPATQTVPAQDWQRKGFYLGAGAIRVGSVKWEGGGNIFDAGTGVFAIFGYEWKRDKIGLAVEDFFTFSRRRYDEQGSLPGYNGRVSMSFNEFNGFITGRAIAYLNDYANISAGAGIGFNASWLEYDVNVSGGYSSTRYWGRAPCFTVGGILDARLTMMPSPNFAMDLGANIIFTPSRNYDVQFSTLKLKSGAGGCFYLGARVLW